MNIPEWLKPKNWSPETKAAAKETIRMAALFAFTLFQASRTGQQIREAAIRKLPSR